MTEAELLKAFEAGALHPFRHQTHIHIAWLYLRRDGWDEGYRRIQEGIKHFAAVHGQTEKYHETITRFWAHLIQHTINVNPDVDDFETYLALFPLLLDKTAIQQHYSAAILRSDEARKTWQEPDLLPMPSI